MCELYGMSSSAPIKPESALMLFRQRGGALADNPDGWGLAYRDADFLANGFKIYKESTAASESRLLAWQAQRIQSSLLVAHVRKARHPAIASYVNTHPFLHQCCNKLWVFAHNGLVPSIMLADETRLKGNCVPNGETDSEYAFCHLLDRIAQWFNNGTPSNNTWCDGVAARAEWITSLGQFNFLLSDGKHLIAYGHDRLHVLEKDVNGTQVAQIATTPLTNEPWQAFKAGELRVYRNGSLLAQAVTQPEPVDPQSISADTTNTPPAKTQRVSH